MSRPPSYEYDLYRDGPWSGWILLWPVAGPVEAAIWSAYHADRARAVGDELRGLRPAIGEAERRDATAGELAELARERRARGVLVRVTWERLPSGEALLRTPHGRTPSPQAIRALRLEAGHVTGARSAAPVAALRKAARRRAELEWTSLPVPRSDDQTIEIRPF